jgi:hypothetical protein
MTIHVLCITTTMTGLASPCMCSCTPERTNREEAHICVFLLLPHPLPLAKPLSPPTPPPSPYMYFRSPSQSLAHDRNLTSYYKALQEQQARGELQVRGADMHRGIVDERKGHFGGGEGRGVTHRWTHSGTCHISFVRQLVWLLNSTGSKDWGSSLPSRCLPQQLWVLVPAHAKP